MHEYTHALFWFRRDLRLTDNAGLYHALKQSQRVSCVFVFDREILDALPDKANRRVEFIRESLVEIERMLRRHGSALTVLQGRPVVEIPALATRLKATAVFANHDYGPDAARRDQAVSAELTQIGVTFSTFKDQVVFERDEVLTQNGAPFSVFTPYKNAWLKRLTAGDLQGYASEKHLDKLAPMAAAEVPGLHHIGFKPTGLKALGIVAGATAAARLFDDFLTRIERYRETRNFPAVKGPSYLSVHLRFGTISIRTLARAAWERGGYGAQTWLNELVWRDFYFMILHHHPRVVTEAFRPAFNDLPFTNDPSRFAAWCEARTGYPLVDAAMRQLNQTGYMHNRLRMITASFLVKDLHIDWRWGERYFARHLNDYDLAANNGGWQWAASTGCDAQPYFRIFNPVTQSEKFDPGGKFIRRYVPELAAVSDKFIHAPWLMSAAEQKRTGVVAGRDYPKPIVDHAQARQVALDLYGAAKAARVT
ncbi:MAG: deoxyribodipyrimidine photo-lyase [Betaproteobacteria bacterium]|nr:deoxyribodipyrimidine photo-lyase [Betaproteobacteria bacterium]